MSNTLSTKTYLNKFTGKTFYIIEVDRRSIEDIILKYRPEIKRGIVPTLLNWLSDPEERRVVWERTLPHKGKKSNLPILMCSEDIDLWCTLIMVEVEADENFVYWNRFGLENSDAKTPEEIGKSIEWYSNIPRMIFDKKKYEKLLDKFRVRLDETNEYTPSEAEIVEEYQL